MRDLRPEIRMTEAELRAGVEEFTQDGPRDCICLFYGRGLNETRVNVPHCPVHGLKELLDRVRSSETSEEEQAK